MMREGQTKTCVGSAFFDGVSAADSMPSNTAMSRFFVYSALRTVDQCWIMKNLSMPSTALKRRVLALSVGQQAGFSKQLEEDRDHVVLGELWAAWRLHLDKGLGINQATLWRAWRGDVPLDHPLFKSILTRFEKALDNFQKPLSELSIYKSVVRLELGDIADIEAMIAEPDAAQGGDALGLFRTLFALIPQQGDAVRFDLWEKWRPGLSFDPTLLRNRLAALQTLITNHFANLDQAKVSKWIAKLDKKERGELDRFLGVQGNARRNDLIELYRLLLDQLGENQPLRREEFFKAWRGDKEEYKDSKLNSACNKLLDLVRKFLAFKALSADSADELIRMVRFLDARDFDDLLAQELPAARRRLMAMPQDAQSFRRFADLEEALLSHQNSSGRNLREPLDYSESLYWGEQDFLLNAFRRYAAAISYDRSLGTQHDLSHLPNLIAMAARPSRPHQDLVEAYLWVVRLLTESNAAPYFLKLRDWLLHGTHNLVPALERELLKYAINYCASQLRIGQVEYEETLARLYGHGIKTNLLLHHAVIDAADLINIVVIFCRTGRLVEAQETFAQHRHRLAHAVDGVAQVFLEAVLAFWAGDLVSAKSKFERAYYSDDVFVRVESRLYVLEILWLSRAFEAEGPAMLSPFEVAYNGLGVFQKGLKGKKGLLASIKRHAKYLHGFYKAEAGNKSNTSKCQQWKKLNAKLADERAARHLSWLRMQCEKAITDLKCP